MMSPVAVKHRTYHPVNLRRVLACAPRHSFLRHVIPPPPPPPLLSMFLLKGFSASGAAMHVFSRSTREDGRGPDEVFRSSHRPRLTTMCSRHTAYFFAGTEGACLIKVLRPTKETLVLASVVLDLVFKTRCVLGSTSNTVHLTSCRLRHRGKLQKRHEILLAPAGVSLIPASFLATISAPRWRIRCACDVYFFDVTQPQNGQHQLLHCPTRTHCV